MVQRFGGNPNDYQLVEPEGRGQALHLLGESQPDPDPQPR